VRNVILQSATKNSLSVNRCSKKKGVVKKTEAQCLGKKPPKEGIENYILSKDAAMQYKAIVAVRQIVFMN
jgi:hypothetical protein